MKRKNSMIKTTCIYFVGNFATKLLTFFLLPLYTMYLSSVEFGKVDLWLSAIGLVAPIFTLQSTESVFRFLCTSKKGEQKQTITNAATIFMSGMAIFLSVYTLCAKKMHFQYGNLFVIYFITMYMGLFLQQILRALSYNMEYAITGMLMTAIQLVLNMVLIIKYHLGGEALFLSGIGGSIGICIFIALRIKVWQYIDFKLVTRDEILKQIKYGIPLIPNQICWWMISILGRYLLAYFTDVSHTGVLAVASKFPSLLITVNSIFFLAWTENIIKEFDAPDRDEYFSNAFLNFGIFSISAAACLLPVIRIYNAATISGEFAEAWKYIPILYIGAIFNSMATFLGSVYTASLKTIPALTTTMITAVVNVLISIIMIPYFGVWGIVYANAIAFIIFFGIRIKSVKKIIGLRFRAIHLLPSVLLLNMSIIVYYSMKTFGQIIFLGAASGMFILLNKKLVQQILSMKK